MDIKPVWTEERFVEPYEGDFQGNLHLSGFLKHMQAAASTHAAHLGFSFESLKEKNMAWVLSRVMLRFSRFPFIGEKMLVRTWPKTIERKIMFIRDFEILAEDGSRFAAATTMWLMIDTRTWRLLPIDRLTGTLPDNRHLQAIEEVPDRLALPEGMRENHVVQARSSDIDIMGHVTNSRYADWVANCFDLAMFKEKKLHWMQINFIKEVRPGEMVSIERGQDAVNPQVWMAQGKNRTGGTQAFEAALGWGA